MHLTKGKRRGMLPWSPLHGHYWGAQGFSKSRSQSVYKQVFPAGMQPSRA